MAYRALWHEPTGTLTDLSVALCSPEHTGAPAPSTELYRWPFAHCYDWDPAFHREPHYQRVCWGALSKVRCPLIGVVQSGVEAFIAAPNDAVGHASHISPYAPTRDYRGFLKTAEDNGGLSHDWLEPCAMTIEDLHHQRRRES